MPKILVIDDDSSIRETLDLYLTEEGYDVYTAPTGTDGATCSHNSPLMWSSWISGFLM